MMEITAETIKQLYPGVYWAIYRQGYREARESPEVQGQTVAIDPIQAEINRQLGLSSADFLRYHHVGYRLV